VTGRICCRYAPDAKVVQRDEPIIAPGPTSERSRDSTTSIEWSFSDEISKPWFRATAAITVKTGSKYWENPGRRAGPVNARITFTVPSLAVMYPPSIRRWWGGKVRKSGGLFILIVMAVVAGCSSGGATVSGNGGGTVAPGHGSPKAAVQGFITDLELGNGSTAWCDYIDPPDQQDCQEAAGDANITITGSFSLGNQVIDGTEALVAITGSVCAHSEEDSTTTISCDSNNDPNKGLPPGAGTFSAAYATASGSNGTTTAACIEVNGSWYINISGQSGTSPTTTPTTIPTSTPTTIPTSTPTTTPSPATTTATTAVP
jgi:hypothetical protein